MRFFHKCGGLFAVFVFILSCSTNSTDKNTFAEISGGSYCIGQPGNELNPLRIVRVNAYSVSFTEITNQQFSEFVKATHYITDAEKYRNAMTFHVGLDEFEWVEDSTANWQFPFGAKQGDVKDKMDHPVTCISFMDAKAYCSWAAVRLPNLEEWEIACRAGSPTPYFWGNDASQIDLYGNIWQGKDHKNPGASDDHLYTAPVASYKPNAFGLYDTYGNVFEFCSGIPEKLKDYKNIASSRGGSWWCSKRSCNFFNSADIGHVNIHASFSNQGFRVAK